MTSSSRSPVFFPVAVPTATKTVSSPLTAGRRAQHHAEAGGGPDLEAAVADREAARQVSGHRQALPDLALLFDAGHGDGKLGLRGVHDHRMRPTADVHADAEGEAQLCDTTTLVDGAELADLDRDHMGRPPLADLEGGL